MAAEALLHRGLLAYSRADTLRMVMELQRLIAPVSADAVRCPGAAATGSLLARARSV
jgi:hypothetical protein